MKKYIFLLIASLLGVFAYVRIAKAAVVPASNYTVAFIGDTGDGTGFQNVLNLIKAEGTDLVIHEGDFSYGATSTWKSRIANTIPNIPYLGANGNHDSWSTYWNEFFRLQIDKIKQDGAVVTIDSADSRNYHVKYKGLDLVFLGDADAATADKSYTPFVNSSFSGSDYPWKVCNWHRTGIKNYTTDPSGRAMTSTGEKPTEMGKTVYEACRTAGAIVATAHEHSYARTKTINKFEDLDPATGKSGIVLDNTNTSGSSVYVGPGKTFAFVSGLGGHSSRDFNCGHHDKDTWWSTIYTLNNYTKNGALQKKNCTVTGTGTYGYQYETNVFPAGGINKYTFGALFVTFNYNGDPKRAHAYFKNIDGQIVDEFDIYNTSAGPLPSNTATPTPRPTSTATAIPQPTASPTLTPQPTIPPSTGSFNPFGTVTLTADFNVNGDGTNVDSIAFWEGPSASDSLMLVTSKGSGVVEVWKYPYNTSTSKSTLSHSCFNSGTNGIWVDQGTDKLYVAVPNSKNVCVFNVSTSGITYQTTFTSSPVTYGIEPNLAILNSPAGKRLYISNDTKVYIHNPSTGGLISEFTPTKGLETMWGDDVNNILYIPDENGRTGVYAYDSTGKPVSKNGATKFGDSSIFDSDEEGIIEYTCPADGKSDDGRGLIIVSDQITSSTTGNDYEVFDRLTWRYLGKVKLKVPGGSYVYNTDGIASTQQNSSSYPGGVFAAIQNDTSTVGISWQEMLSAMGVSCGSLPSPTPAPTSTSAPTPTISPNYIGDVNRDGVVNFTDYQLIQPLYGTTTSSADFNGNGKVDIFDINMVISRIYTKTSPVPTTTTNPQPTSTSTPAPTRTPTPRPSVSPTPTIQPTISPTLPPYTGAGIGPISLSYKQGGIWLTPAEIAQIPMDNASWDSLVTWSKKSGDLVGNIYCTAGGACTDTQATKAMYAKAIVGMRTNNQTLINEAKNNLDRVEAAVHDAIDVKGNVDPKWGARNIGLVATTANILDYRPDSLRRALRRVVYDQTFNGELGANHIKDVGMKYLSNIPSNARWAYLSTAYLLEDWNSVNDIAKAQAKAMGEKLWAGQTNNHIFELSGSQASDGWKKYQPNGLTDPYAVMPAGIYYNDHGIGGLYLADQWRAGSGPQWPPAYTDYIYEGMGPNNTISWAMHHLGYKNVFQLGNYALLRGMIFAYSTHDGKSSWTASGNDAWQTAAIMTWAKSTFGSTLPSDLKPEPNAPVSWPIPVSTGGDPGRSMGFMYATHYARLAR